MIREIPLTQGQVALVDTGDYDFLMQWKWAYFRTKTGKTGYAGRSAPNSTYLYMHRIILDAPKGVQVDHKDLNGLNNIRANLRFCTPSQNSQNRAKDSRCSSQYKGVSWHKSSGLWFACLNISHKRHYLGYFRSEIDAAIAYNAAAIKHFGEFARINDIQEVNHDRLHPHTNHPTARP
jgi:hypothetical protein